LVALLNRSISYRAQLRTSKCNNSWRLIADSGNAIQWEPSCLLHPLSVYSWPCNGVVYLWKW
jgi:hypothetical protein